MRILFLKLYSKCVENPCNVLNTGDGVSWLLKAFDKESVKILPCTHSTF